MEDQIFQKILMDELEQELDDWDQTINPPIDEVGYARLLSEKDPQTLLDQGLNHGYRANYFPRYYTHEEIDNMRAPGGNV
jgi:hypothetical protein